jgi:hypothetical protein
MCGPVLGLVGAAVSAFGSMASAEGQASSAEYNAQVEKINARTQRQKGAVEQERISDKYDKQQGQSIAAAAKSGVDPGYGSAALVIFGEGGANKSADMSMAYVNAEGQAVAHENKAKAYENDAKNQRQAGAIGAASSFLSGLGGAMKSGGGNLLSING